MGAGILNRPPVCGMEDFASEQRRVHAVRNRWKVGMHVVCVKYRRRPKTVLKAGGTADFKDKFAPECVKTYSVGFFSFHGNIIGLPYVNGKTSGKNQIRAEGKARSVETI